MNFEVVATGAVGRDVVYRAARHDNLVCTGSVCTKRCATTAQPTQRPWFRRLLWRNSMEPNLPLRFFTSEWRLANVA